MALSTYSELQSSIADWMNQTNLTAVIPDFIRLAEAQMNRVIRVSQMEQRATTLTVAGQAYYSLPTDYLALRDIQLNASPNRSLSYMSPEEIDIHYDSTVNDTPNFYTIVGNEFQLAPAPSSEHNLEISYYQQIPALSDSSTTNWLLTAYPDIYLYGSLVQAEPYMKNDQRIGLWKSALEMALNELKLADRKYRWSGQGMNMRIA